MLLCVIVIISLLLLFFKFYIKFTTGKDYSYTCLVGKTAIVTGANTGIGYVTALEFAKRGARVILACRNLLAAEKAKETIINRTDNPNVIVKHLDLSSLKSVQDFANDLIRTNERIHILVNNAGCLGHNFTSDGLQSVMQSNYFGSFLLTLLLLDILKQSSPSRIVNVSSVAAKYITLDPNEINSIPSGINAIAESRLYGKSKLCNILFTVTLADRLKGTEVTVNALHPGAINTDIFRRTPKLILYLIKFVIVTFYKTPEEGAQTSIYLSVSKDLEGVSGCYFTDCKKVDFYKNVTNQLAEDVWKKTEALLAERGYLVKY